MTDFYLGTFAGAVCAMLAFSFGALLLWWLDEQYDDDDDERD